MIPESRPHPVERLFFALLPPRQVAASTAAWVEDMPGDWTRQRADRLHVTLAITGDFRQWPVGFVDGMLRAGEAAAAAPFEMVLDRLSIGNRSAALRPGHVNPGLKALHTAIAGAMAHAGVPLREGWRFSPHMTLGYGEGRPVQQAVEARTWRAEEFVLIRSLVGRTQHRVLGRWPLRAEPARQYALF